MKCIRLVKNQSGLTLVELLAVWIVPTIIFSIAAISFDGIKEKVEEDVCAANRVELERQYRGHLYLGNVEHSKMIFVSYLKEFNSEVCPVDSEIFYSAGHVDCSVHGKEVDEEFRG